MSCETKKKKYAEYNNAVKEYDLAMIKAGFEDKLIAITLRAMERALMLFGRGKTWKLEFKRFCQSFMAGYENVQKILDIVDQTEVANARDAYINEKCDPCCTVKNCDACGKHDDNGGGGGGAGGQKGHWEGSKWIPDPLALDLDGNGIAFTKNGAYFDLGTDGFAERATWIGKGDGLLALDKNNDGKINNGSELFGDAMRKKDGTLAKDGFDALADYDLNKDGKIDAADDVYSKLRVWVDANGDGVTDDGELKTLAELGIKQLNLGNTAGNGVVNATGEALRKQGSFVWENGAVAALNEYGLSRDAVDSKETELLPVPDDVKALPDVRGWGNVHSLQQAIVRDKFVFQLEHRKIPLLQREN